MHEFKDMDFMNSAFNTGAFVTSGDNVMVASWGFVGVMWGKKVFVAPIRDSRYTKEMLDKTGECGDRDAQTARERGGHRRRRGV